MNKTDRLNCSTKDAVVLTNNQEKLIRALYTRQGRKKHNMCICEGVRACSELVVLRPDLIEFSLKAESFNVPENLKDINFITVPDEKFKKLSSTVTSQGVLIVASRPEEKDVESLLKNKKTNSPYFVIVLDGVADPGNMGTIIRTAKAAGLKELFITSGSADPFADKVVRAAIAAQFAVDIIKFANLAEVVCELRKLGINRFWKTDPHGGKSLFEEEDLFANSAIIIGGEAAGVSDHPDCLSVTIPMPGESESLNAAQAATIFMFEAVRRTQSRM